MSISESEKVLVTPIHKHTSLMWCTPPPGSHGGPSHWGAPAGSGCPPWRRAAAGCSTGSCARCQSAYGPYPSPAPPACSSGALWGNGEAAQMRHRWLHEDFWLKTDKKKRQKISWLEKLNVMRLKDKCFNTDFPKVVCLFVENLGHNGWTGMNKSRVLIGL